MKKKPLPRLKLTPEGFCNPRCPFLDTEMVDDNSDWCAKRALVTRKSDGRIMPGPKCPWKRGRQR
ncbi:MAG: hypothetical protein ABFE07_28125 [Armatimonadia bacterium]